MSGHRWPQAPLREKRHLDRSDQFFTISRIKRIPTLDRIGSVNDTHALTGEYD
jgi:hypothetical protein